MKNEKYEETLAFLKNLAPELVFLSKIESNELRERAKEIRGFCKRKLDFIHSQGLFRFYNSHGVTHSEKILKFMEGILSAAPSMESLNDYELFLLYVSAYCHDLGLLRFKGEDFYDAKKCTEVRTTHCERIVDYLRDNWREMRILNETEATILSNICQAHGSKQDLGMLDKVSYAELDTMDPVPVRERLLGAILRLADALDADELRLPYEACREDGTIPWKQHVEYFKHELVDSVKINPQKGIINVHLRIKYEDPIDEKTGEPIDIKEEVTSSLEKEFGKLFSWDNVPGDDNEKLIRFLIDDFCIDWAENAEIRNSSDSMTIIISKDENSAEIMVDGKKDKAILKISDGRTHELKVKTEDSKLNIYKFGCVEDILADHGIELNGFNFVHAKAVSLKSRKPRPAFAKMEEGTKHDYSPRWRFFEKLDLSPPTDMIEYKKDKNKKELLNELKLMTIDGDLVDEELQILLQEAKKEGIPDEETIRLIVEFLNENNVKTVGIKEEKLPGIRKDLITLRKDYLKT